MNGRKRKHLGEIGDLCNLKFGVIQSFFSRQISMLLHWPHAREVCEVWTELIKVFVLIYHYWEFMNWESLLSNQLLNQTVDVYILMNSSIWFISEIYKKKLKFDYILRDFSRNNLAQFVEFPDHRKLHFENFVSFSFDEIF